MILDLLEDRFMQIAANNQKRIGTGEPVPAGEIHRLAKGLEYLVKTLKQPSS